MAWAMVVGPRVSATQVAEALEREPHTMETGWPTFAEPGPKGWSLITLEVPPRP